MKELLRYIKYLKPYKWYYIGGLVAGILNGALSGFGMAFVTAKVLPFVFSEDEVSNGVLVGVVLLVPLVALLRALTGFLSSYWIEYCNQKVCLDIRQELMLHLQSLSLAFFHKTRTGNILARVMIDTQRVTNVVTTVTADLVRQPVTVIGAFGVILYLSYEQRELGFLAISFFLLPICIVPIREIVKRISKQEGSMGIAEGGLNTIIHENVASAREVRAFNLQEEQIERFDQHANKQREIILHLSRLRGMISPSVEVISAIGVGAAIFYAAKAQLTLGMMIPLLIALYMCYGPFKKIGVIYADIKRAELAVERIEKIYLSEDILTVEGEPQPLERFTESLEFKNVSFGYTQKSALEDVSVKLNKGEVVALVGQSGSGKSTFCNLVGRFYDPQKGIVTIDGINLRSIEESELRKHMAFIPQDCFLYAESIMDNIRFGRLDASDEDVIESAKRANAHEFILELKDGYDTVVAERGGSLSGGQRQRIAIARAFLRDAPILIMDEATSALDGESERKVQSAIERLMNGKTVILIAHRFSTIQMAKRVLLFDAGRIVDEGSVEEILERSAEFRRMKESEEESSSIS